MEVRQEKLTNLFYLFFIIILTILLFTHIYNVAFAQEQISIEENKLFDKIIVIGDSRMELIDNKKDYDKELPSNMKIIAKSGKEVKWFNEVAMKKLANELNDFDNNNVAVVINMGVNDLQKYDNLKITAKKYTESIKSLMYLYPDVKFYILSVNPINEEILNEKNDKNVRTNNNIEKLNYEFEKYANDTKNKNLKFCDSYNNMNFNTNDGLHYTKRTNEKIIDFIINDCVK